MIARRAASVALRVVASLAVSACAFQRYRYFSLEQTPDAVVLERGAPDLPRLHFASLPLRYRIERDLYRVEVVVPARSDPYLVGLEVWPGEAVSLACSSAPNVGCTACAPIDGVPEALRFTGFRCGDAAPPTPLRFDVLGADGTPVGAESLPVALEADGFYWYSDLP